MLSRYQGDSPEIRVAVAKRYRGGVGLNFETGEIIIL